MPYKHLLRFSALLAAAALGLLPGCGSDSTGPDTRPPAAVTDLAVSAVTETSAVLMWTAPGDDGGTGTAAAYDIRYSTAPITGDSWDTDTQAEGEPAPQPADSTETFAVTVVQAGGSLAGPQDVTYYFALRTVDESDNRSALSNLASSSLLDSTPPGRIDDLAVTAVSDSSLFLQWTTPGDDGFAGRATAYEVRYALSAFDEGDWDELPSADNPPDPGQVYTTATMELTGLTSGVTVFVGIRAVDERGNRGAISNLVSAAPYEDMVVTIPDPGLQAGIRAQLGIPAGDIFVSDLAGISGLNLPRAGITDLSGLEFCFNLVSLDLQDNGITGLAPLSGLTSLTDLDLDNNNISDAAPLAGLINLETLSLNNNLVTTLADLTQLASLRDLRCSGNLVNNASAVSRMAALEFCDLRDNNITSLPAMAALTRLKVLWLRNNNISNIAPVGEVKSLIDLDVSGNALAALNALSDLDKLEALNVSDNLLSDLEGIESNGGLKILWASGNAVDDLSSLSGLNAIQILRLRDNPLSDISALAGMDDLRDLDISGTRVTEVSVLEDLSALMACDLSGTPVVDLLPLVDNTGFGDNDELWVVDCDLLSTVSLEEHIPALEARGVTVHQ